MTAIRAAVTYGLGDTARSVACAADRALEGHHVHVSVQKTVSGEAAVWLVENGDMLALGYWFLPGEQLVVSHDGWRIEDVPEVTP
jgi:hypothetical protein